MRNTIGHQTILDEHRTAVHLVSIIDWTCIFSDFDTFLCLLVTQTWQGIFHCCQIVVHRFFFSFRGKKNKKAISCWRNKFLTPFNDIASKMGKQKTISLDDLCYLLWKLEKDCSIFVREHTRRVWLLRSQEVSVPSITSLSLTIWSLSSNSIPNLARILV